MSRCAISHCDWTQEEYGVITHPKSYYSVESLTRTLSKTPIRSMNCVIGIRRVAARLAYHSAKIVYQLQVTSTHCPGADSSKHRNSRYRLKLDMMLASCSPDVLYCFFWSAQHHAPTCATDANAIDPLVAARRRHSRRPSRASQNRDLYARVLSIRP